ncbi:MAG: mandelate racemase/muconate lactonizing enzyme family protein [Chloroflexota bacterium]
MTWTKPGPLTIQKIETEALRIPLNRIYKGSKYSMQNRCTIITRVYTHQGVVGEVYTGDTDKEQGDILSIINNELAPALIGMDVFNTDGCWEAMKPTTYDILRDRGVTTQAIGCVDTAIWDTLGKALEMPLYKLWGNFRNSIPIIAIGGYYNQTSEELAREVSDYVDYGMAGMKFKVGGATPEEDIERLKIARQTAGEQFMFMVDANQGYTLQDAIKFVKLADNEGIPLRWFEEPVRWYNDKRWLRDVRHATGVPVTAGQSEYTLNGVRDLMVEDSIDVCNFDASWGGGPTIWRRAAGMASAFGIQMGHHEEAQLSSHLLCGIAHGTYIECFHKNRDPLFWDIQTEARPIKDGIFSMSDRPGLGLLLDRAYIKKYKVA